MPTNFTGRITLIFAITLAMLWAIFPGMFKGDFGHGLKPGIDMVGGTSLLYEIKAPAGTADPKLAEQVMEALKKRVDPDGVRNLIWRPQGGTRLEIQMPLSNQSGQAKARRDAYATAQRSIEEYGVRVTSVVDAIQNATGDARRDRLAKLSQSNTRRDELFGAMASVWDQIQASRAARDAARQAELESQFDSLRSQIDETNLSVAELENVLQFNPTQRDARLKELKQRFDSQGFATLSTKIDEFAKAYDDYTKVRGALDDSGDLKRLLRGSGVLEFHILPSPEEMRSMPEVAAMIQRLRERGPRVEAGDTLRWFEVARPDEMARSHQLFSPAGSDKKYVLGWAIPGKQMINAENLPRWSLEAAYRTPTEMGIPVVGFRFDPVGARLFSELTGANVGQSLAISLDDKIITAPNIRQQISRQGTIDGGSDGFTASELNYLISTLAAGSLPAQLAEDPISERTVGPQLGKDNLRAGLTACAFGLIVVAVFLIGYYYISGVVAMIAVLLNVVFILGAMAALNATFTLPGVAGIVLTIGMAVDANVLIFERLREEQARGMGIRLSLRNAYDRAFSAILDGNVTTAITSFFLMWMGSEEVKGFGITLLLGIVSSLFTALFVTKTIFALMIDKLGVEKLGSVPMSLPWWNRFLRPNIDWMKLAPAFYSFSIVFMVIGLVLFSIRWSQSRVLDVEFANGTAAQFELREPIKIDELRSIIQRASDAHPDKLPAPAVVSVGADEKTYEVITPNDNAAAVKEVLKEALQGKLNLQEPSQFAMVGASLGEAINRAVFPIEPNSISFDGITPTEVREHIGGVAFILRDLRPMIAGPDIERRLDQQRLQVGSEQAGYRKVSVETFPDQNAAVVLMSDDAIPYDKDPEKWQAELAVPGWRLVNDAINNPVELQKVTNFSPQVAGETQFQAIIALVASCIVIMAYIWIRFGNLRYGTATIVALLHDTLFVVAAIGVAHYASEIAFFRDYLLLEPFRVNLTVVAAILTVMGWSMNDTVVVFDRIRENRGKHGVVDRQLINDSINQTLSRTLLTGGTTLVTLVVMYINGGPGIHGFTFSMVVGIIVGTYSSVAIASPLLLIGQKQVKDARKPSPTAQLQRA
ncbi:MAG TPA: protein translocase subunit SecD [Tepidisphaeraceae bacterium]|nr:protein translocase subunit SecD [Tepidisphaeraceae bacterium]